MKTYREKHKFILPCEQGGEFHGYFSVEGDSIYIYEKTLRHVIDGETYLLFNDEVERIKEMIANPVSKYKIIMV